MFKTIFFGALLLGTIQFAAGQDYRFGKVSKEELLQKQHQNEPNANAAILYREISTEFKQHESDGFYIETEYFERIKIYNKEGFEQANKLIKRYKGSGGTKDELRELKAYTYTLKDGKIEEERLRNDGIFEEEHNKFIDYTKITMPNIKEGCVIEYRYKFVSPFYYNIDTYQFQDKIPVDKLVFEFAAPEYFGYKTHQNGWLYFSMKQKSEQRKMRYSYIDKSVRFQGFGQANSSITTKNTEIEFREESYTVAMENIPSLKKEPFSGNIDNYAAGLKFELSYVDFPNTATKYYTATWEDVSKTIYESNDFGKQLDKLNYFDDDVSSLIKGISDPTEKVKLIFEFVKSKMNWNENTGIYAENGIKEAYKKGSGNDADINLLLVAMLRQAGIDANPVLVSSKANGIPLFPTRDGFNYVIGAVDHNGEVMLLDATQKQNEINILSSEIMNWRGRVIRENATSAWVSLEPKNQAVESALISASLNADLSLTGTAQTRYTGNYALDYRGRYTAVNNTDQNKMLEESFDDAELSEIKFENLNTLYTPVSLSYNFEAFNVAEEIGGKIYVSPLLFLAEKENPFKSEERNFPINFSYPKKDRYIVNIALPEGYVIESLPESTAFALDGGGGSFRYRINQSGNILQIAVELSLDQTIVLPEDYGNLKKFFQLLIDKENEKVVLSKA